VVLKLETRPQALKKNEKQGLEKMFAALNVKNQKKKKSDEEEDEDDEVDVDPLPDLRRKGEKLNMATDDDDIKKEK